MKIKTVGKIDKLSSGKFNLYVAVNFELNEYEVLDRNRKKTDSEFIREASEHGKSLLRNYKSKGYNLAT